MAKLFIEDLDLGGKRVIMRVDFNVPLKDAAVENDKRLRAALPSIKYVLDQGATGPVPLLPLVVVDVAPAAPPSEPNLSRSGSSSLHPLTAAVAQSHAMQIAVALALRRKMTTTSLFR